MRSLPCSTTPKEAPAMSERLLTAFREEVERTTPVPAFELIEAAGRARRRRRHAIGGAVAACLLAATGLVVSQDGRSPAPQPAEGPDPSSSATVWPGPTTRTLEEGTYDLTPFADLTLPAARVTVPDGWNAGGWGPDRFAGVGPAGADNDKALRDSPWYAGLLVLDVNLPPRSNCASVDLTAADTEEVLSVLMKQPRQEVVSGPAVHLTLRETRREPQCPLGSMFDVQGRIGQLGLGGTYELLLVEVEDEPLLVVAGWTRNAPRDTVAELLAMADSIELHPRELPWRDQR
jgi:hypothetical protein